GDPRRVLCGQDEAMPPGAGRCSGDCRCPGRAARAAGCPAPARAGRLSAWPAQCLTGAGRRRRYATAAAGHGLPAGEEAAGETAETIVAIPQVSEVYSVTGEFDLVAMVRVRNHEELGDVIPGRLNKVSGVTHTETHIAFRTYSRHDLEAAF